MDEVVENDRSEGAYEDRAGVADRDGDAELSRSVKERAELARESVIAGRCGAAAI